MGKKTLTILQKSSDPAWSTQGLGVAFSVDEIARAAAMAIAAVHRDRVRTGQAPLGPQRPLGRKQMGLARQGRRPPIRGLTRRAYFPNSIRANRVRAGLYRVQAGPRVNNWLKTEQRRGVEYFGMSSQDEGIVGSVLRDKIEVK